MARMGRPKNNDLMIHRVSVRFSESEYQRLMLRKPTSL